MYSGTAVMLHERGRTGTCSLDSPANAIIGQQSQTRRHGATNLDHSHTGSLACACMHASPPRKARKRMCRHRWVGDRPWGVQRPLQEASVQIEFSLNLLQKHVEPSHAGVFLHTLLNHCLSGVSLEILRRKHRAITTGRTDGLVLTADSNQKAASGEGRYCRHFIAFHGRSSLVRQGEASSEAEDPLPEIHSNVLGAYRSWAK